MSQATVKAPPPRFIGPRQAPLVPGVPVKALPSLSQAIVVPREEPAVSALPQPSDTRMFIWDDNELTDDGWAQLGVGATVRMRKGKGKGKDGKGKLLQLFAGEGYYTFWGEVVELDV